MAAGDVWEVVHGNSTTGDIQPSSGVEVMLTAYVGSVYNSSNYTYVSVQPTTSLSTYVIVGGVYKSSEALADCWQYHSTSPSTESHGSSFYCKIPMNNSYYLYSGQRGTGYGNYFAGYIIKD